MMARKHLHELLQEDQEPFLLKNYISERKSQLQVVPKSSPSAPKKRTPITPSSISKRSLYKQACFFSFKNSPDLRMSPAKSSNPVGLHVPARTAALLLESALRIKNQSSGKTPKTQIANLGPGLLASIFRRLSGKNLSSKKLNGNVAVEMDCACSCSDDENRGRKSGKLKGSLVRVEDGSPIQMGFFSCSCSTSRRASTIWSESNEEKLDLESRSSCCSSRSYDFDEEVREDRGNEDFGFCDEKGFCSSPLRSPFRFALETSSSSGDRTPAFSSPAASPSRHKMQESKDCEGLRENKEEEEEKEQFSPVSVLDPPFEEEDEDEDEDDCNEEEGNYDLECSYAIVQSDYVESETGTICGIHLEIDTDEHIRVVDSNINVPWLQLLGAKQQLLHKLRRFEKLAELDPIELEKRMQEEQDEEYMNSEYLDGEGEEEFDEAESLLSYTGKNSDYCIREVLGRLGFQFSQGPAHMERLVSDLIAEEKREDDGTKDSESMVRRVCTRLDSWKEEKSITIHKMVSSAFRSESDYGWKRVEKNQVIEAAMEIEQSIFRSLLEELSEELMELGEEFMKLQ